MNAEAFAQGWPKKSLIKTIRRHLPKASRRSKIEVWGFPERISTCPSHYPLPRIFIVRNVYVSLAAPLSSRRVVRWPLPAQHQSAKCKPCPHGTPVPKQPAGPDLRTGLFQLDERAVFCRKFFRHHAGICPRPLMRRLLSKGHDMVNFNRLSNWICARMTGRTRTRRRRCTSCIVCMGLEIAVIARAEATAGRYRATGSRTERDGRMWI